MVDGQRLGLCLEIRVREEHGACLLVRGSPVEARDDAVNGGGFRRLGRPREGLVREPDPPTPFEEGAEEGRDGCALRDRVRRDEGEAATVRDGLEVVGGLDEPSGHVVEVAVVTIAPHDAQIIGLLLGTHELTDEGGIADDSDGRGGRARLCPLRAQRVADRDVGGRAEGKDRGGLAEQPLHLTIRLMVGQVQGRLGDAGRPLLDLDAEKVVQLDHDLSVFSPVIEEHRGLELVVILAGELQLQDTHQDLGVQAAQFAVGDNQEVAAAAGGVADRIKLDTRACGARVVQIGRKRRAARENASEFTPPSCLLGHFGSGAYHRGGDVVGTCEPRTPRLTAERKRFG